MSTTIQAVTFDAGGTLIEPWPSVGDIYAEVAERHGAGKISPNELNRKFTAAWHARKDFGYTRAEWATLVDESFAGLATMLPSRTFFPELYNHFAQPSAWRVYDDVRPTLAELKSSGMRLGVISNWDERLRPLLEQLGLDRYFEVVTVSCEAGATKPSRGIFDASAKKFGLAASNILHIGDSFREDVEGARGAGFRVVHLARHTATGTCEQRASLREIGAVLQGFPGAGG